MVEIEIDGEKIKAEPGSSLLKTAIDAGKPIPHFCYHKKLSVTASCRMCLVELEGVPKLAPACATPVTDGMKVHTQSEKVSQARRSVMEFLLINHPLDCPVCDQAGECMLQDNAVAHGGSASRYQEAKRMVFVRDVSPLISMREMNRCIECTRCIRFGEEIAGVRDLGMVNRGERSEIATFDGSWVTSELSGNMIDICPVGALTSKPYRYSARSWELSHHPSVSPHDGLGSNLDVQTLRGKVMRVVPAENEEVNECWLSDRDRFSYEALNSQERLTVPMVKQDNRWIETDWETALSYVAHGLGSIRREHGDSAIAALVSPQATTEECFLMQKLVRQLGSEKIEFRLGQADASFGEDVVPWLGMKVADIERLDHVLVVGSFLRDEAPLMALRLRKAAQSGASIDMLHAVDDDWLMPLENRLVVSPDRWLVSLYAIMASVAREKGIALPEGFDTAAFGRPENGGVIEKMACQLLRDGSRAIILGEQVMNHEKATQLCRAAEWIARATGATLGMLTPGANAQGAYLAGARPLPRSGISMDDIASASTKAFVLLHTEPELDAANPPKMLASLKQAEMVVCMSPFKHGLDYADVLLPVAPFTETSGTYVSHEGRLQSFSGAATPPGQTRPAWKVLRVLGNFLDLKGFEYDTTSDIMKDCIKGRDIHGVLNNMSGKDPVFETEPVRGFVRVADRPACFADVIVRRAKSLQQTQAASAPAIHLPPALFAGLGIADGDRVRVCQPDGEAVLPAVRDTSLPDTAVRLASGHPSTVMLGPVAGAIRVERI